MYWKHCLIWFHSSMGPLALLKKYTSFSGARTFVWLRSNLVSHEQPWWKIRNKAKKVVDQYCFLFFAFSLVFYDSVLWLEEYLYTPPPPHQVIFGKKTPQVLVTIKLYLFVFNVTNNIWKQSYLCWLCWGEFVGLTLKSFWT